MILTKNLLYYHKMELLEHHSKVENNNYRLHYQLEEFYSNLYQLFLNLLHKILI